MDLEPKFGNMATAATCPGYVTGLFCIEDDDASGAGFAVDAGMRTSVSEKKSGRTVILINGSESPAPVSKTVMRKYSEACGKLGLLEIRHETGLPIGYGLGMSAAGALSLSLALNELLGAGLRRKECVKIAHDADVECGTGLSGVDAAAVGGAVARKAGGKPVKLDFGRKEIELAFFSPIRTSSIIRSAEWKSSVNDAGSRALELLFRKPDWGGFVKASRQFSREAGLSGWCEGEMEKNPHAGMAMLGHTLFCDRKMELGSKPMKAVSVKISNAGAKLE